MRKVGLLSLLLLLVCCLQIHAKVYLVSIGIADYPGKKNDLHISDNDAKTIAKVFQATKDASVKVLTNEAATKSALLSTMHTAFTDAESNDAVVLYFSGHGTPGALVCHDGLLTYQRIFEILKGCKATKKIVIVDACYAGKMRTTKQQTNNYNSQSVMLFLSSRTNETSMESKYQNSMFTIFLERGLRGGADINKDCRITARELYDFVHKGVIEASGNKQHPVMWGKFDNDMTVIKW
ncbi:caspase family protein [Prevotella communis]|uniref:caspase family protein n=1 Tax=Prevotella communis TaxID=2913614 RepID=UPI001EDB39F0|nr:caspase family protein [Prevotella communis]UKK55919.1 caspase family protein [Prevotella communis]